jgi:hypothetical protein
MSNSSQKKWKRSRIKKNKKLILFENKFKKKQKISFSDIYSPLKNIDGLSFKKEIYLFLRLCY